MMEAEKEYALALFFALAEEGREEEGSENLSLIVSLLEEEPEYLSMLSSPALSMTEKKELISEAFGSMEETVLSLLMILCENGRIGLLPRVIGEYERLHRAASDEVEAVITSAVALTESQKEKLLSRLEEKLQKKVFPLYRLDPSLIGGVKVEADGVCFDGSVKKRLSEIKDVMIG